MDDREYELDDKIWAMISAAACGVSLKLNKMLIDEEDDRAVDTEWLQEVSR
jgi:hypothetical protein